MAGTLDIDLLRSFVAITEAGGFTAASARLARTQAAVSMQLKRLEAVVGRPLLIRGRHGPALTAEGERLIGYARRLLALHDEALGAFAVEEIAGTVRLGTPDDYAATYLPPVIARFAETHPRVQIEIHCDLSTGLERQVARGAFDLAIVTRAIGAQTGRLLRRETVVWCAAADHRPELIDPLPLALFPEGCRFRPRILAALAEARRPARIAYCSASLAGVWSAVAAGFALTCLGESSVPANWRVLDAAAAGLPRIPPAEIALLFAPQPSRAARRLADHLAQALRGPVPRPPG